MIRIGRSERIKDINHDTSFIHYGTEGAKHWKRVSKSYNPVVE